MISDAQLRANTKYNKTKTICFGLRLNNESDKDVIDFLKSVDNKQGYIKELIRKDMQEKKGK